MTLGYHANQRQHGNVPAIGLILAFDGVSIDGGGISTKSFLSSLMAVSTRAWSGFDSFTYDLLVGPIATRAPLEAPTTERRPRRPAVLNAFDERLAMFVLLWMDVHGARRKLGRAKTPPCDFINEKPLLAKIVRSATVGSGSGISGCNQAAVIGQRRRKQPVMQQ